MHDKGHEVVGVFVSIVCRVRAWKGQMYCVKFYRLLLFDEAFEREANPWWLSSRNTYAV